MSLQDYNNNINFSRFFFPPYFNKLRISLHKVHVMQQKTFAKVHVKRSVILIDCLGPDMFPHLKVQVDRLISVLFSLESRLRFVFAFKPMG